MGDQKIPSTILIVDDQAAQRLLVAEALQAEHRVLLADSGEQALQMAMEQLPDLILLDVQMPGMSGYEVCNHLMVDLGIREIPIIFMTDEGAEEENGLAVGGVDAITKPIRPAMVQNRVATHLKLKAYQECLKQLSMMDTMTGVATRRRFDDILQREWHRAQRQGKPVTVILVDVDHFSLFNKTYGTPAGDECLKRIATAISGKLRRATDLVARLGGEEFACLLPEMPKEVAATLSHELLEAVQHLAIPHAASPVAPHVTVSIGTATMIPVPRSTPKTLMVLGDQHLYQAKRQGRNQVVG